MTMKTSLLLVYFGLLYYLSGFQEVITPDGFYYCAWTVDSVFPVGYAAMIWLFHLIIPDVQLAATLVSMLAMCGSTVVTYLIARHSLSQWWSVAAGKEKELHRGKALSNERNQWS